MRDPETGKTDIVDSAKLSAKYAIRCPDVIRRNIDGELFLVSPDGRQIHILNKTAACIWELSGGELSCDEIVSRIVDRFGVQKEEARKDLFEFYQELASKNLVQLVSKTKEDRNDKQDR